MKYEITKGSEKDFEGAPEWATLKERNTSGDLFFSEGHSVGCRVQGITTEHDFTIDDGNNDFTHLTLIAERRPITEPVWDGEWLPPAGCHCEVKTGKDSWNLCKIVFSDDAAGVAFVYLGGDEEKYVGSVDCIGAVCAPSYFRPMRSPEDVARDEAVAAMFYKVPQDKVAGKDLREAIYDAIAAGKIKGVVLESKLADLKINITTDEMWREFEKKSDMEDVYKLIMERASRRGSF